MENTHRLYRPLHMYRYIFAGKGIFTLKSLNTQNHLTYKFIVKDNKYGDGKVCFAYSRKQPNIKTQHKWSYIGIVKPDYTLKLTKASKFAIDNLIYISLQWYLKKLQAGTIPENLEFYRSNTCGRCGRELTDATSIQFGFGPECIKMVDNVKSIRQNQVVATPKDVDIANVPVNIKRYEAPKNSDPDNLTPYGLKDPLKVDGGWYKVSNSEYVTEASDLGDNFINPLDGSQFDSKTELKMVNRDEDNDILSYVFMSHGIKFIIFND